jgi:3-phosphoshikimate 1-carboxyvinyltransferase
MNYKISCNINILKGELKVPASKSISNRLLIIQALCNPKFNIYNLSDSDDTKVLQKALTSDTTVADIGHAGTSMRFLTAFFASQQGERTLTGSTRMKERPIGKLVDALRKLGADIECTEKDGFPPLFIKGKQLDGGKVAIDSSVSSQFISALLLSSPTFKNGLELELENKVISSSYIEMTVKMMQHAGVRVEKKGTMLVVKPQKYIGADYTIEGDWSGVSYWYEVAVLAKEAEIFIHSLQQNSVQGDAHCAEIFKQLGITTEYKPEGILIKKTRNLPSHFNYDFIENPDLVQTLVVTCVMLNIPFKFIGTQSLRIKETDRIAALQNELSKFGATLKYSDNGTFEWDGKLNKVTDSIISIATYDDHRMALAFAPIAITGEQLIIENQEVISKSYPGFWDDLKLMGYGIEEA